MHLYIKGTLAYARSIFRPDREDRYMDDWQYKSNVFKRYAYYTTEELMIVDDAHGGYVGYPMPAPFNIPGKIYHRALYIWQVKIKKTHV